MARTILELEQSVIKNCNFIYNKYADMEEMNWDAFHKSVEALRNKYIDEDDFIQDFITMRIGITIRDLGAVRGGKMWPITRNVIVR